MEPPANIPDGQSDNPCLSPEALERLRVQAVSEASDSLFDVRSVEAHLSAAYEMIDGMERDATLATKFVEHLQAAERRCQHHLVLNRLVRRARKCFQVNRTIPDWTQLANALYEVTDES